MRQSIENQPNNTVLVSLRNNNGEDIGVLIAVENYSRLPELLKIAGKALLEDKS